MVDAHERSGASPASPDDPKGQPIREIHGSCLCGAVRYVVRGSLSKMACCHCVDCRKASGAEFATNATVATRDFELLSGEELVSAYESSPRQWRAFCSRCGSPLFKRYDDDPDHVRLRLGLLDTPIEERPLARIYWAQRMAWSQVDDDLPRFDGSPG